MTDPKLLDLVQRLADALVQFANSQELYLLEEKANAVLSRIESIRLGDSITDEE